MAGWGRAARAAGTSERAALSSALLAIASGVAPRALPHAAVLTRHVRRHRLGPLAHLVLRRAGAWEADLLQDDLETCVLQHLKVLSALQVMTSALGERPWVVLKGPVLSELAHPVAGLRPYGDLDLLVDPQDLEDVVHVLQGLDWRLQDTNHRLLQRVVPGELHLRGPSGIDMDLHWSITNSRVARQTLPVSTRDLLARRVVRSVGRLDLPTLDDADLLLHLCLHAARSGADVLLWLLDVDNWVRRHPASVEQLRARARAVGAGLACGVVLSRSRSVFGTPVPAEVLEALLGEGVWPALAAAVDRVQPVPGLRSPRNLPRLIARATRADGTQSVQELGRKSLLALLQSMRASSGESVYDADEAPAALAAYFGSVREEGRGAMGEARQARPARGP